MNKIAHAIAAAQDPILDEIVRLERLVDALGAKVEQLANRPAPEPGPPGPPGLGIDAPAWEARTYREGAVVTHYHGQYFKAVQDTADEPGDSPQWKRIGFAGIRWRGELVPGMELRPGDQYREASSLFLVDHTGAPRLLNHRGERGPRGKEGPPGKPGASLEDLVAALEKDELGPLIERLVDEYVIRQVVPTIREIGERLVTLERGRL